MKRFVVPSIPVLLVALVWAGVASGSPRAPAGFYEAVKLEPAASFVAGKPVTVLCAKTAANWSAFLAGYAIDGDPLGLAIPGGHVARLNSLICDGLDAVTGRKTYLTWQLFAFAGAIETVTHEAIHLRGESDEGITDCDAMHEMPRVAVRFFGVTPGKKLRALMAQAWRGHEQADQARYRTVC